MLAMCLCLTFNVIRAFDTTAPTQYEEEEVVKNIVDQPPQASSALLCHPEFTFDPGAPNISESWPYQNLTNQCTQKWRQYTVIRKHELQNVSSWRFHTNFHHSFPHSLSSLPDTENGGIHLILADTTGSSQSYDFAFELVPSPTDSTILAIKISSRLLSSSSLHPIDLAKKYCNYANLPMANLNTAFNMTLYYADQHLQWTLVDAQNNQSACHVDLHPIQTPSNFYFTMVGIVTKYFEQCYSAEKAGLCTNGQVFDKPMTENANEPTPPWIVYLGMTMVVGAIFMLVAVVAHKP